jgi:hypothetical protein
MIRNRKRTVKFNKISTELMKLKNPAKRALLQRFFKTGKGEYGFGDIFLGVTVFQQRVVARKFADLPLEDVKEILGSKSMSSAFRDF